MQFVLPSLLVRAAHQQRFALFESSVRIAARNSVYCSQRSTLDGSNPFRNDDFGRPARADCAGRALGDVGDAIAHGRCAASMLHYAMRIGHIGVTSFITNPSGKACRRPRKV